MLGSAATATAALAIAGLVILFTLSLIYLIRLKNASSRRGKSRHTVHLLVVLGSGGHTEEMLSMMRYARLDPWIYAQRTYLVSSGDSFSARKAAELEREISQTARSTFPSKEAKARASRSKARPDHSLLPAASSNVQTDYAIVTIPRARKVHQSFLTAPLSTLHCLWACFLVLQGKHLDQMTLNPAQSRSPAYPDVILTNGPGIAVCVVIAARMVRLFNWLFAIPPPPFEKLGKTRRGKERRYLRTIFIESWARVTTLSLSGKLILPIVDRFLVQWKPLEGYSSWNGKKTDANLKRNY
ncbi:UDP-N-acetylglucosamine transferase subunit alg14 [Coccidioides immitis H538.4]|uniref:UDP-N-acetylglucosamine transferase subunit ALG14 n=1 Tax=Coccidioides immitis H538.4 TaxID=396776 RepID=A0A0J8RV19_COCIT|nr:UDP-N-acetylglucosamine transferase subunit alg14 [Coccidioides immitis H538.4]